MKTLASNPKQLIYIYSENSDLGKRILPYIISNELPAQTINLNKSPLSQTIWAEIIEKLNKDFVDVVDSLHDAVKNIDSDHALSDHDWLNILKENPEIIQNPIIIHGDRVVQADSRFDFYEFLEADGSNFDKSPETIKAAEHKDTTDNEDFR